MAAETASRLLAEQKDVCVLHGDIHHGNILYFGSRGWLAIDPKGLMGERTFDYANLFCNPDGSVATRPGRLTRQLAIASGAAGVDARRLSAWVTAWAGLSAAFLLQDGLSPEGGVAGGGAGGSGIGQTIYDTRPVFSRGLARH